MSKLEFSERSVLGLGSVYILLFLDIDECAAQVNPCDALANSACKNTNGSYNCQCNDGFVKNGPNCEGVKQLLSLVWMYPILFQLATVS